MNILIIGAGLGGLTFGAAAARDGHQVTLIDVNRLPGGVTQLTQAGAFSFEQGPLILTDLMPHEPVGQFLGTLGIELSLMREDRGLVTPDFALIPPETYAGPYWRRDRLKEIFPQERGGIDEYYRFYDALMEIRYQSTQPGSLYQKLKMALAYRRIKKYENMSCQTFTDHLFKDERLKLVFNGILADFCADPEEVQCFTLPFVNTETAFDKRIPLEKKGKPYYPGYHYIVGGCQKLAEALSEYILSHGGTFLPETAAEKVLIQDGRAAGLRLTDGRELFGDRIVGTGSARDFFYQTVGEEYLTEEYCAILESIRPMEAVFMLHLGVDFDPRAYQKQTLCYYYGDYDLHGAVARLRSGVYHEGRDGYLIYFPDYHAPDFAPDGCHCVTIYTVCPDTLAEGDWEQEKERFAEELIRLAERQLPELSRHIVEKKIVTAADYRTMMHMSKCSFGGLVPIWKQPGPPHKTPVKGLIFIGQQSENGGGVPIVINGSIAAYEEAMKGITE